MAQAVNMRHVRVVEPQSAEALTTAYYDKSWGFVIGINDYGGEHPMLANARHDAEAFANLLRTTYKFDQVITLYDQEATGNVLMDWLRDKLASSIGQNDRLVIFFAGHGVTRVSGQGEKRGYLIPHDAQAGKYADYLDMTELRDACGWIRAKHILLILDCCFSGVAAITARSAPFINSQMVTDVYLAEITRLSAWQILTAGAADELVADSGSRPGHSAFTSALLAGLEGQADQNADGIITASELAGFVKPEVSRHSRAGAKGQTPFFNYLSGSDQGDFVFLRHDTTIKILAKDVLPQSPPTSRLSPRVMVLASILLVVGVLLILRFVPIAPTSVIGSATPLPSSEANATLSPSAHPTATQVPTIQPTAIPVQTNEVILEEAEQWLQDYWALWGNVETCQVAWGMLTDSFQKSLVKMPQGSLEQAKNAYLNDCRNRSVKVLSLVPFEDTTSKIEAQGRCILVRLRFERSGHDDTTFGLIKEDPLSDGWKIHFGKHLSKDARLLANKLCG